MASGSVTHFATLAGVLDKTPPANVVREPKCVRSGPMYPFETPSIRWQVVHGLLAKILAPSMAAGEVFWFAAAEVEADHLAAAQRAIRGVDVGERRALAHRDHGEERERDD